MVHGVSLSFGIFECRRRDTCFEQPQLLRSAAIFSERNLWPISIVASASLERNQKSVVIVASATRTTATRNRLTNSLWRFSLWGRGRLHDTDALPFGPCNKLNP